MEEPIKVLRHTPTGKRLKIYHHTDGESPRTWDNIGRIVAFHRRYYLADDEFKNLSPESFESWDDIEKYLVEEYDARVILPVYMLDHSGVILSTSPFSCRWDSGQIGFIFADGKTIKKEFGFKRVGKHVRAKISGILDGEIETLSQYLNGEVYGFVEEKYIPPCEYCGRDGQYIATDNSVWDFYGDDVKTNGMLEHVEGKPSEWVEVQD